MSEATLEQAVRNAVIDVRVRTKERDTRKRFSLREESKRVEMPASGPLREAWVNCCGNKYSITDLPSDVACIDCNREFHYKQKGNKILIDTYRG